jgi:hypothetical protein
LTFLPTLTRTYGKNSVLKTEETRPCENCGKAFAMWRKYPSQTRLRKSRNKFCSISCAAKYTQRGKPGILKLSNSTITTRENETSLCKNCNKQFLIWGHSPSKPKSWLKKRRKFCSVSCAARASAGAFCKLPDNIIMARINETTPCKNCGNPIQVWRVYSTLSRIDRYIKTGSKRGIQNRFCSKLCATIFVIDNAHFNKKKLGNNHIPVIAFGETKNLIEWSNDSRCMVHHAALIRRIRVLNWNPEKAITTPSKHWNYKNKLPQKPNTQVTTLTNIVKTALVQLTLL